SAAARAPEFAYSLRPEFCRLRMDCVFASNAGHRSGTMGLRAALAALLWVTGASVTHSRPLLEHTSPTSGSAIHEAPPKISLSFSDALVPSHTDAVVRNASGGVVSSGKARVMGKEGKIEVPVKQLAPGKYRVEWYATA